MNEYGTEGGMYWDATCMTAWPTVHVNGKHVRCGVSYDAIAVHYRAGAELRCLAFVREQFDELICKIEGKIAAGGSSRTVACC